MLFLGLNYLFIFKKLQLGINKIQRKGTECLSLVGWGNTLLKYGVVLGTELVTVSVVLHTPWGGWALLLRHLLNSRVSRGISPVIYFCLYSFTIHASYCSLWKPLTHQSTPQSSNRNMSGSKEHFSNLCGSRTFYSQSTRDQWSTEHTLENAPMMDSSH